MDTNQASKALNRMTLDTLILRAFGLEDASKRRAGSIPMTEIDYDILLWRVGYMPTPTPGAGTPTMLSFQRAWNENRRELAGRYSDTLNL